MTETSNIQAELTLRDILDEKLCEKEVFRKMVVNYRLLELAPGGRLTVFKDDSGLRIESSIWTNGIERIMIEALRHEGD